MPKILIVEDDPAVRGVVELALEREGMRTLAVADGEEALKCLGSSDQDVDLVVLDVMLPGMDGVSVCREIRTSNNVGSNVPIIMLTARDDETSVLIGLEVGADDYVTKPFSPRQLVGRIRAHLRRRRLDTVASTGERRRLEFPGLEVDLLRRQVLLWGAPVDLTAKQYEVLVLLATNPGRVYNREQIIRYLWDGDFFGEARAADVHVQHIRKKIESDPKNPRYIHTVRGMGYKFAEL